ncbi:hypothetical protein B7486_16610 [cyanobacterium TDX16]|nr:hypothetical protein B7486_16610 [cyanobacterium TDX16]
MREEIRAKLNKLIDDCPDDQLKLLARTIETIALGRVLVKGLSKDYPKGLRLAALGEEIQENWNHEDQSDKS